MSTLDDLTTGEPKSDRLHRMLYAQDASVYEEEPLGVVFPRSRKEVERIVEFADTARVPLIPRGGGTSLAGQCVGEGLVVDLGRHMNRILEVNAEERWVRVEPGVILDDLNRHLADYDLFFGPDTSTSNRCMIGGMIGNNSCGSHSIYYGTTRDHVLEVGVVLADGSFEVLGPKERDEWIEREGRGDLLGRAMHTLREVVESNAELIDEHYPRPDVVRRNTGYALDIVSNTQLGGQEGAASLASLICGSEGTLGLVTEAKLNLVDRPCENILVCAHFERLREALEATIDAVEHEPAAVELMDRPILELTKGNREQRKNRFFVEGDPEAILVVEFYGDDADEVEHKARRLIEEFKKRGRGYAHPIVRPPDDGRVWALRKAGLGLLMGMKGDTKPVTVVEDTAVAVDALPDYIDDFADIMDAHGTRCVYYAHASVGELHLRPELNLKDAADAERFQAIAAEVVDLVKHYGGSLSGEHGDGRLRSPLLEQFYGADIMALHRRVKEAFDPHGIFNPRKIVDPEPIDVDWRYGPDKPTPDVGQTVLDWSDDGGLVRAVEKCNGAGVCRKRAEAGGTMCPSYMATLDEKDSTRGRANVFRQALYSPDPRRAFRNEELREALDLCLSCKACKTECPANVDMARMKAEFTQQYHDKKGTPLSALLFGHYRKLSRLGSILPALTNLMLAFFLTRWLMRLVFGISTERTLPAYAKKTFREQFERRAHRPEVNEQGGEVVWLYVDPFTEYTEPGVAMAAARVLEAAGYRVELLPIEDDGRTQLSKGLVRSAARLTEQNLRKLEPLFEEYPHRKIVGLEPSALLTFRDETLALVDDGLRDVADELAQRAYLFEEFVADAADDGQLPESLFHSVESPETVFLHGHCHQKALVGLEPTERALGVAGYAVETIPSGCCGMAGSFGYEADHYDVSMQIGELVLFPALREADEEALICAPGTSCRHQIADGVDRRALHPAELLERALAGAD